MKHDPITSTRPARAFVLFRSGGRLDLLNLRFDCWTDEDLAHSLARISRWGGATRWQEPLSVAQHSRSSSDSGEGRGSDAPRGAEGIAARRFRGPARLGSDRSAESPILASLFASSSNGCRPLSASATPCRRGTPPPTAGTKRPIVSPRPLKPVTSSAGAARTCAMRSASSANPSRTTLFRCPGSNRGSLGHRGSPSRCSCTDFSTFEPLPSCTKARSRDDARPLPCGRTRRRALRASRRAGKPSRSTKGLHPEGPRRRPQDLSQDRRVCGRPARRDLHRHA